MNVNEKIIALIGSMAVVFQSPKWCIAWTEQYWQSVLISHLSLPLSWNFIVGEENERDQWSTRDYDRLEINASHFVKSKSVIKVSSRHFPLALSDSFGKLRPNDWFTMFDFAWVDFALEWRPWAGKHHESELRACVYLTPMHSMATDAFNQQTRFTQIEKSSRFLRKNGKSFVG